MKSGTYLFIAATLAALAMTDVAPAAAADARSAAQQCIDMKDVDHTNVIDGSTILVTMKRNAFRRIDLASRCVGLAIEETFSFNMQTYEMCRSTPLRVVNGGTCIIDKIVPIEAAEAKALLAKR